MTAEASPQSGGEQRHAPDRRHELRRAEDRMAIAQARWRTLVATSFAICGGLAALYYILAAMGAFDVADATVATAAALGLTLVWAFGFWYRLRTDALRVQRSDRERRGF
jgi:hypothetical protein